MKEYMNPTIEVVSFSTEDVLTTSGGNFDNETDEY